jgi:integrase
MGVFQPSYTEKLPKGSKILERITRQGKSGKPIYSARVQFPNGKTEVIRTNEAGTRRVRFSRTWHIRITTPDGQDLRFKGYRDKRATEAKAAELQKRIIREHSGLSDPTDEHAKRPLAEHAEDFRRYLTAKGNTPEYVALVVFRLTAVLDSCRFIRVGDVQASAVVTFLAELRGGEEGKSIKTANEYLAAAKNFTRWLWRDRRLTVDPLACLSKLTGGAADVRHARRDFSADELRWLLDSTRQSVRPFRRLCGLDRYTVYLTAAATGFRTSELASLTPESFDLNDDTPTATVQAACTKNRKEAVQPLPRDVATILKDYLRGRPAGQPVWPGTWCNDASAKMIRKDLTEARANWLSGFPEGRQRDETEGTDFLAYVDAEGRHADFHALRHTFITMVGKSGVSPKEHQDLARHSTYALTGRYTHSRFYDLSAAVQGLPILTGGPEAEAPALRATGTDGTAPKNLAQNLAPRGVISGDSERQAETSDNQPAQTKTPGKPAISLISQGKGEEDDEWRRRESNPRPVALQRPLLRV